MIEHLETRMLLAGTGPRITEYLDRGVVATRATSSQVFVSWRSLVTDAANLGFNLYRSANGAAPVKLNSNPLTGGTNFTDTTANAASANRYYVRPVLNGSEQAASGAYTLKANSAVEPLFSIPLRNISGTPGDYYVHLSWIGDLDGDGEYDFVVDRIPTVANVSDKVEAYKRDGTFLWSVDMGPNSLNKNNIEPGSSTISVGNWDGVTVYDLDMDGKAEVLLRTANGVVFGDGTTLSFPSNNNVQFMSVLNGMTGAERTRIQVPTDYLSDGPMAAMMGVGYLDGARPSLVVKMKNRIGSGDFNLMMLAYDFDGTSITQNWKWNRGNTAASDGHQMRIVDVDQDGTDEVVEIGYVLNGNGTLKYSLASQGIIHGDRFHIGDLDPDRPGLEGYGVQQDNPSGLLEYYYDAATGQMIHRHFAASGTADVGRGIAADIDPNHRGYEYWSFSGIYNSKTLVAGLPPVETKLTNEPNRPWPNFRIWWDGDVLSENLNGEVIDKWNPATQGTSRVSTLYQTGANATWRDAPTFYGDIIGDWREEVIYEHSDHTRLLVYTTQRSSTTRLYSLAQNPAYRNGLTLKGYLQSHMVDYYLGDGMATPPTPNIAPLGAPAPVMSSAFVAGTTWASAFNTFLATSAQGEAAYGFRVDPSAAPDELPWTNLNKVSLRFTRDVNVTQGNLSVTGISTTSYAISAFAYDRHTLTATWTLNTAGVSNDKLRLNLTGVTDAATGAPLDGPASLRLNVLPGDVNRSGGSVIGSDVTLVRNAQNATPGGAGSLYTIFKDVNGSGSILGSDVTAVRNRQGTSLPAGEPLSFGAVPLGTSRKRIAEQML